MPHPTTEVLSPDALAAVLDGSGPRPPMWDHLGLRLISADNGTAQMEARPQPNVRNGMGVVHGGLVAGLIDSVTGAAVWSTANNDQIVATIDLGLTFIRGVRDPDCTLLAEANVVHRGRTLRVAVADVHDDRGRLIATGRATYHVRHR